MPYGGKKNNTSHSLCRFILQIQDIDEYGSLNLIQMHSSAISKKHKLKGGLSQFCSAEHNAERSHAIDIIASWLTKRIRRAFTIPSKRASCITNVC
ncbi:hypothetical protein A359_06080 [secondary endosymbiont of Ctenarytaina eucalypti]|uniref:Uncharacterized protein n=1 Tax=secondary endosymbiont of Ctenarytaina eucalypti TaxID=1199245 RepID=J3TXN9_9ENTR|nr:hypothetical protein A359_06080 [secondary endosymbiont of Ctenarytaina eucalypti]